MSQVDDAVGALRSFNRSFTRRIGVLDDSFLGRGRPLGACRILFEVGPDGAEVGELRERLALDRGYLSRTLRSLEDDGLVRSAPDPEDGRRRRVELTEAGVEEWEELDRASDEAAEGLLAGLDPSRRRRLAEALGSAERLLVGATVGIELIAPDDPAAVAAMDAYFAEIDDRFPAGFDPGSGVDEGRVAMRPPTGGFWVARDAGSVLGCVGLQEIEPAGAAAGGGRTGEIKRMWVSEGGRGTGLGRRLLAHVEAEARTLGFEQVVLDTNETLVEAMALYRSAGYVETERYNDNPYPTHWFRRSLHG